MQKSLFDKNEHYTNEAYDISSDFGNLVDDFIKEKCKNHNTHEIKIICDSVIELNCCVERIKKSKSYINRK